MEGCYQFVENTNQCVGKCRFGLYIEEFSEKRGIPIKYCQSDCADKLVFPERDGARRCTKSCNRALNFLQEVIVNDIEMLECTYNCKSGFYKIVGDKMICYPETGSASDCA